LPFPDLVEGGVIVRDDSGHPNGPQLPCTLFDWTDGASTKGMFLDNAQDIIFQPELTEDDLVRRFSVAVKDAVSLGLTSVHDAGC
jgi:predicted amidohydrolase YtcJ